MYTIQFYLNTAVIYVFFTKVDFYYYILRYCKGGKQYFCVPRNSTRIAQESHNCAESSFEGNLLKGFLIIVKCEKHEPTRRLERATTTTTEQAAAGLSPVLQHREK